MHPRPRSVPSLLLVLLLLPGFACRASAPAPFGKPEPYVPLPDEEPPTIGYFLTLFDGWLARWSELRLSAASPKDQNELLALQTHMRKQAAERCEELLEVLESGAPLNRRIAAAALGFSGDPTVLGALLASLSDRDPDLAQKALLGIGVLSVPETPLGGIRSHLLGDGDGWTRNNAAFVMLALARGGNRSSELAESCRLALTDEEPGVRAQCASALGVMADTTAVPVLSELLFDRANLVALAASSSLARVGREHSALKGGVARALASALERVGADRRQHFVGALRWLSGIDLGEEAVHWLDWARKLP